jgi:hypothetical protein
VKWIILSQPRGGLSVLAYEYDSRSEAQAFYNSASELSDGEVRMFEAILVLERKPNGQQKS